MKKNIDDLTLTTQEIENELNRLKYKKKYKNKFASTINILITVAAIAILVATLWLPVLQIYGNSMNPALSDGDIVVSLKNNQFKTGDVIAFYYNNKILVKRVIAQSGDWVNIDEQGNVYVNHELLDEPYLTEKALGDCDIEMPYQVPESRIFVMGDNRTVSIDSRNNAMGCVAEEQIVGQLIFKVWPLNEFGEINH